LYDVEFGIFCLDLSSKKQALSSSGHIKKKLLLDMPSSSEHIKKKLLLDKPEGFSDKQQQHWKSDPCCTDAEACAVNTEQKNVTFIKLSDLQPVDQKDSEGAPSRIISKASTASDKKSKPKKHVRSKDEGSGGRDSADAKIVENDTDLLLSQPGKSRKSRDSDAVVKHGEKPELKVKKRLKSTSGKHGSKDSVDTKTTTTDKSSAFSLNQLFGSPHVSSDLCDFVQSLSLSANEPEADVNSRNSSRTEGHGSEASTRTVTMGAETEFSGKDAASSLNQPSKCEHVSTDMGSSVAEGPESKQMRHMSLVNEEHDTGESGSSLMAVIDKGSASSLIHEHSKFSDKGSICEAGRKPHSTAKMRTKSYSEEHGTGTGTKNVTNTKVKTAVKGADFCLNSQKRRAVSSGSDGTGLSGQRAKARVKSDCSRPKVQGAGGFGTAVMPDVSKSTDFPSRQKASSRTEENERLQNLWRELDSGLRSEGSQPSTSSVSGGQCLHSKKSEISENAAKSLVTKRHKSHVGTHVTKEAATVPRSDEYLHGKQKWVRISILGPHHHQQVYGDASAAGGALGRHYKIPHKQRHTSSHPEHHAESATVHASAARAKKQAGEEPSVAAHDSAAVCRPHPENLHPQKNAHRSPSHQVASALVHSVDAGQADKPKSKVLSLDDYKKRKGALASTTAVTLSVPTKVVQSDDPLHIKSSLAEQLIISYTKRTEMTGSGDEPTPVKMHSSESTGNGKCPPDYDRSEPTPLLSLTPHHSVEGTYGDAMTAKQLATESEDATSFGDIYSFQLSGQTVLRAVEQKKETVSFNTNTCNTMDIQSLSSSSSHCDIDANQTLACNSAESSKQTEIPLSRVKMHSSESTGNNKCPPDNDQPTPLIALTPQHLVEGTYDDAMTAKQHATESEDATSFGDVYSFQNVLRAVEQKKETVSLNTNTSHTVRNTVEVQSHSSSSSHCDIDANQMLAGNFSESSKPTPVPLPTFECQPDYDQSVAEVSKTECAFSSGLSLAADPYEKTQDTALESPAAVSGRDTGFVPSHFPLFSETLDSDVSRSDDLQFASVGTQDAAAETPLDSGHIESELISATSVSVLNLGNKSVVMTDEHGEKTEISASNDATKSIPHIPTNDVLETQGQLVEQADKLHYFDVDTLKTDTADVTDQNDMEDDKSDVLASLFQAVPCKNEIQNSSTEPRPDDATGRDAENRELGIYISFT